MSTQFTNRQWRLPNNENKDKQSNYSLDFTGSELINVSDLSNIPTGSSHRTVSAWFNTSYSGTAEPTIVSYGASATAQIFIIMLKGGSGADAGRLRFVGYSRDYTFTTADLRDNQWHHVAMTYNGTIIEAFLDGSSVGSFTPSTVLNTGTSFFKIGVQWSYWVGQIDSVCIFDYVLSASQITTLYGSSSTGIGNPMTLNPVAYYPLGDQDAFNGSNYLVPNSSLKDYVFDFIPNDYISFGNAIGNLIGDNYTGGFTISFWMNPDTTSGEDGIFNFSTNEMSLVLRSNSIRLYNNGQKASISYTNPNNEWSNCVLSFLPSGSVFYLNGVSVANWTYTDLDLNGLDFSIGWYAATNYAYDGKLSNFQIWNTNLSLTEAETLYNNGSPYTGTQPQNSNLIAWWKLDASATYDGSNWTIPDDSTNSNDGTSSGMTQANLVQSDLSFTSGYSPYALDFDGANDYIDCGTGLGDALGTYTGNLTFSIWFKTDTVNPANDGIFYIGDFNNQGALQVNIYNNNIIFRADAGIGSKQFSFTDTTSWHNLTCVYLAGDRANSKLYLDGVLQATADGGSFPSSLSLTGLKTIIGSYYSSSFSFDGSISNCSIWNTSLTSAQVTEIYNEGVPSNLNNHSAYSNLVSWWQLGSNSSFNSSLNQWTCIDEKGTNTGESSQTFNENAIVDGVGSYANGVGTSGLEVIGSAPFSDANSLSVNMDVEDRVTGISNATITTGGTGYATGTNIATTGGTGSGCTVDITASGAITAVTINNSGLGYSVGEVLTVVQSGGSSGTITVTSLNTPS